MRGRSDEPLDWIIGALRTNGYAMVQLSPAERELVDAVFARSREFFGCPQKYKESFKVYPMPGGYLTPFPGTYEIFELRRGLFRCPQELAGEAMGAFGLLERLGLAACAELGRDLGMDFAAMPSDSSPAMRCIHYDRPHENKGVRDRRAALTLPPDAGSQVRIVGLQGADAALNGAQGVVESADAEGATVSLPPTAQEVVASCRGSGSQSVRLPIANLRLCEHDTAGVYPAHTDSSLVTVAPRSAVAALEVKDLHTGEWFCMEEQMRPDDCVIFVGDPLDYASSHQYRAIMHRAAVPSEKAAPHRGQPRISMPLFLYPRDSAVLEPHGLPRLIFDDINGNVNKCRDKFPWKRKSCYYSDLVYSETT